MKKKKYIILSVLMLVLVAGGVLGAFLMFDDKEVAPTGNKANIEWYTEDGDEFVITTEEELYGIIELSKYYDFSGQTIKLGADIVINDGSAKDWGKDAPAKRWYPIDGFAGTFDGQGHSISGVYGYGVNTAMGLFSNTKMECIIKDFKLLNSYFEVDGSKAVGSVASNGSGTFEKIYSDAFVTTNGLNAGGLVGKINDDGVASVTTRASKMTNCWFDGTLAMTTKTGRYGGGLIGHIYGGSFTISHCLNSGTVSAECQDSNGIYIGGLIGRLAYENYSGDVIIEDSLNVGKVVAKTVSYTGSLVGAKLQNTTMSVKDTYVTEESYSDVCSNAIGTPTGSAMMVNTDFVQGEDWYSWTTLNYDEYWTVTEDSTPILKCFAERVIDTSGLKKAYSFDWYNQYASESVIDSVEDLYGFAIMSYSDNFANKIVKLGADIKVNEGKASNWANGKKLPEKNWIPIGRDYNYPFQGTFDGNGYTISGLYGKSVNAFVGLFGMNGIHSEIKNVKVINSYLEASGALGSITGRCEGKINTAYSDAYLKEHTNLAGGIAGYKLTNDVSQLTNCWYDGVLVLGDKAQYCGGIVGRIINGTLEMNSCLFSGKMMIEGEKHSALSGGFIGGIAKGTITVNDCLNSGEIVLTDGGNSMPGVGRVFGYLSNSEKSIITITNTYFTNEGFNGTYHYYRDGEKQTIKGGAEVKETESVLGYNGYRTTSLDFKKYWTVVVNEDGTPILKSFAKKVPSVAGLEKTFDKSWYSEDKTSFVLKDAKDLYGLLYLSNSKIDFKDKTVILANDIQLNEGLASDWAEGKNIPGTANNWGGIGKYTYFQGTFDGQGHTVSGLYGITDTRYLGFFGCVGAEGIVKNVSLKNSFLESTVEGLATLGSIVGRLGGKIDTVYSDAIVQGAGWHAGGLVGGVFEGTATVIGSSFAGELNTKETAGGLVGYVLGGKITVDKSSCSGSVTANYSVGGLVSRVNNSEAEVEIKNSTFSGTCNLTGTKFIGGLVGYAENGKVSIQGSESSGIITATKGYYAGGLVGEVLAATVTVVGSNFKGELTAKETAGGLVGYVEGGKVTVDTSNCAGKVTANWSVGGLVSRVNNGASVDIKNSSFDEAGVLKCNTYTGGLVGHVQNGEVSIQESESNGNITATKGYYAGGLVGNVDAGQVSVVGSSFKGELTAKETAGGLVGYVLGGKVTVDKSNCVGTVTANWSVGGLVSRVNNGASVDIKNSSFGGTCKLAGTYYAGGLVGYVQNGEVSIKESDSDGKIAATSGYYAGGLVGDVDAGQVSVVGSSFKGELTAKETAGGLVGYVKDGKVTVDKSSFAGTVTANWAVGGLVSRLNNDASVDIKNSSFDEAGVLKCNTYTGGLVGHVQSGTVTISSSDVTGTLEPNGAFVGGLIGNQAAGQITIKDSYSNANITASANDGGSYSGGIIGNVGSGSISIESSYYGGVLTASGYYAGGLVGNVMKGTVTINSSNVSTDSQVTGKESTGGLVGYVQGGKVTVDESNCAGKVTANWVVGGLVSRVNNGASLDIKNSSFAGTCNLAGSQYAGGFVGYVQNGKVTIQGSDSDGSVNAPSGYYAGALVGNVTAGEVTIKESNVGIAGTVTGKETAGGLVGYVQGGKVTVDKSSFAGTVNAGWAVGGLVSRVNGGAEVNILNSSFVGTCNLLELSSEKFAGGFVGYVENGTVSIEGNEFNGKVVTKTDTPDYGRHVGGFVGYVAAGKVTIKDSSAGTNGTLTARQEAGGFVGSVYGGEVTIDDNSSFKGTVNAGWAVGGLVGRVNNSEAKVDIKNSSFAGTCNLTTVASQKYAGGLVGYVQDGTVSIQGSDFNGSVVATENVGLYVGGLVGNVSAGAVTVKESSVGSEGNVTGYQYIGGIIGQVTGGAISIEDSSFDGELDAASHFVGGFIGDMTTVEPVTIKKCYVAGSVNSTSGNMVGGFIGSVTESNKSADTEITMEDCLNKASVSSSGSSVGGLIGRVYGDDCDAKVLLTRCLNMGTVQGKHTVGSLIGRKGDAIITSVSVYVTKTSNATASGTGDPDCDNVIHGYDENSTTSEWATLIDLNAITVSDTLTAATIKTSTLNGLFGTDTIWTIGTEVGSTPELQLN